MKQINCQGNGSLQLILIRIDRGREALDCEWAWESTANAMVISSGMFEAIECQHMRVLTKCKGARPYLTTSKQTFIGTYELSF